MIGKASWYGDFHHGRRTASGEVFNMNALTAAHRTLPLGTRVRVTNLSNWRSVEVRVNDRGPYIKNRIIDVSRQAAAALGAVDDGVFPVQIVVLD
jgi:rare lipoprotein A